MFHIHCVSNVIFYMYYLAIEMPFCKESCQGSQGRVEFNIAASTAPSIGPPDLSSEDYNSVGSVYSSPLSPSHIQTVLSSYNSSISENFNLKSASLLIHTMLILKLNTSCPLMQNTFRQIITTHCKFKLCMTLGTCISTTEIQSMHSHKVIRSQPHV